jgi:hypothetical protein
MLGQTPATALDVKQQAGVVQDLKLLANSCPVLIYGVVADVAACSRFIGVIRMKLFQLALKNINFGGCDHVSRSEFLI